MSKVIGEKGFPSFREEKKQARGTFRHFLQISFLLSAGQTGGDSAMPSCRGNAFLPVGTQQITSALSMLGQARQQAFF